VKTVSAATISIRMSESLSSGRQNVEPPGAP
jgi:hypothetical protein